MENEKDLDVLYVKKVVEPLEGLIQQVQSDKRLSKEKLVRLDEMLLDKYLELESMLKDNVNDKI